MSLVTLRQEVYYWSDDRWKYRKKGLKTKKNKMPPYHLWTWKLQYICLVFGVNFALSFEYLACLGFVLPATLGISDFLSSEKYWQGWEVQSQCTSKIYYFLLFISPLLFFAVLLIFLSMHKYWLTRFYEISKRFEATLDCRKLLTRSVVAFVYSLEHCFPK